MTTITKDRGCSCQEPCGCEVRTKGDAFLRPRYFGGMLLTEDDLQAMVDYVVGKRRLTNRYLFGSGVVCGLDVTCHPCDQRSVRVDPGYALDCCGNDIVVSCPEDVDIIDLVRELRRCMGTDCGEPCDDQPHATYYLYVRYVEQPIEPVAPYATDDCATGDCEFSRTREAYCFELRCEPPEDCDSRFWEEVRECVPKGDDMRQKAQAALAAVKDAQRLEQAQAGVEGGEPPDVEPPKRAELKVDPDDPEVSFDVVVDRLARAVHVAAEHAAAEAGTRRPLFLNQNRLNLIANGARDLAERLEKSKAYAELPPTERERIGDLITVARERPDLSTLSTEDRTALRFGYVNGPAAAARLENRVRSITEFVRRGLERGRRTNCSLYKRVRAPEGMGQSIRGQAEFAASSLLRLYAECTCGLLNPPCPCCTDNSVLLAAVRVEGCEVVDICPLERRWIASPRALTYWLPHLDAARRSLRRLCCDVRERPTPSAEEKPTEEPSEEVPMALSVERQLSALIATVRDRAAVPVEREPLLEVLQPLAAALNRPMPTMAGPERLVIGESADIARLEARLAAAEARLSALDAGQPSEVAKSPGGDVESPGGAPHRRDLS